MIDSSRKAKITWQCRRGMLELDLLLKPFAEKKLNELTDAQLHTLESLLNLPDPLLYDLLLGREVSTDKDTASLVDTIKLLHNAP